jgi:hypothetical protein
VAVKRREDDEEGRGEMIQPSSNAGRGVVKMRTSTLQLLRALALYRVESMLDTLHAIVAAEVRRESEQMRAFIDSLSQLAETPPED